MMYYNILPGSNVSAAKII